MCGSSVELGTRGGQTCEVGVGYEVSLSALTVDRLNATRHNVDQDSKPDTENSEKNILDRLRKTKNMIGRTAAVNVDLGSRWMSSAALWC